MTEEIFRRSEEMDALRSRLRARRSFLMHGPAGVGKTLLLKHIVPEFDEMLYCGEGSTAQAVLRQLAELLLVRRNPVLVHSCKAGGTEALKNKSAISLKGIVADALRENQHMIVLDHLKRPSASFAAIVRELMISCSTPIVAVARSEHMEDAGFVMPLLPDRSEKLAIRNFDNETGMQFAQMAAARYELIADNLHEVLSRFVSYSEGNPGAMLRMIQMATQPKYRFDNQIKLSLVYIDFKMRLAGAEAR